MTMKRSLWTLVVPLSLALAAGSAWAQDEEPADGMEGDAEGGGGGGMPDEAPAPEGEGDPAATGEGGEEAAGEEAAPATDAMVTDAPAALTKANWPTALVDRPITNAKGMIEIRGDILVNMSKDAVGKPFAIAPDIYYSVSDVLMVGLTHSTGLCLAGKDNNCPKVYDDVGVDAVYAFLVGKLNVGAHVGVAAATLSDPMLLRANVGVLGQYTPNTKLNILFDPSIGIGLTERDFNKEGLAVPVQVDYQATPKLAVSLMTGIGGPLDGFGDAFSVPVGLHALFGMSNKLDFGMRFMFTNLAGKNSSADGRVLTLFVNARL